MIVKYKSGDTWGYIDNVRQVGNQEIDAKSCIDQYDNEVKEGVREVIEHPVYGMPIQNGRLGNINKVYAIVIDNLPIEIKEEGFHAENLLNELYSIDELPVNAILLYLNDHKEYENVVLITNQDTYLLNDNGKTIERLV